MWDLVSRQPIARLWAIFAVFTVINGCGRADLPNRQSASTNSVSPPTLKLSVGPIPVRTAEETALGQTTTATEGFPSERETVPVPVASVIKESSSLSEQLKTARSELEKAEVELQELNERCLSEFHASPEYQDTKRSSDELEETIKVMRSTKSPRLPETSKQFIAVKNKLTKLVHEYEKSHQTRPEYLKASSEIARLKGTITDLAEAIRQLAAKAEEEKRLRERVVEQPTAPSSGGTVYVKGYYRKDGTYVRGYTRRK